MGVFLLGATIIDTAQGVYLVDVYVVKEALLQQLNRNEYAY